LAKAIISSLPGTPHDGLLSAPNSDVKRTVSLALHPLEFAKTQTQADASQPRPNRKIHSGIKTT